LWENEDNITIMMCMYEGVILNNRTFFHAAIRVSFQTNSTHKMQNVCTGAVVFFSMLFAVLADPQPPVWQPTWSQSFFEVLFPSTATVINSGADYKDHLATQYHGGILL